MKVTILLPFRYPPVTVELLSAVVEDSVVDDDSVVELLSVVENSGVDAIERS